MQPGAAPEDALHERRLQQRGESREGGASSAHSLMTDVFQLLDSYIMTSREQSLNTAACRLLQNIMPGVETAVIFQEKVRTWTTASGPVLLTCFSLTCVGQEGLVEKLMAWAREAERPLNVYATGLLARAMGNQEVAAGYREQNSALVGPPDFLLRPDVLRHRPVPLASRCPS